MEETTSPVVPILQIVFLTCRKFLAGIDCIRESRQLEKAIAKSDSTVSTVIWIWVTDCFLSVCAAANGWSSTGTIAIVWLSIATFVLRITAVRSRFTVAAADLRQL
jgi:hypothetical protein